MVFVFSAERGGRKRRQYLSFLDYYFTFGLWNNYDPYKITKMLRHCVNYCTILSLNSILTVIITHSENWTAHSLHNLVPDKLANPISAVIFYDLRNVTALFPCSARSDTWQMLTCGSHIQVYCNCNRNFYQICFLCLSFTLKSYGHIFYTSKCNRFLDKSSPYLLPSPFLYAQILRSIFLYKWM